MPEDTGTSQLINQLTNPPNPFEQYGKTLNFAAGLRQFQANQAGADAYRQAVDPVTGALDMGKFNSLMAAGPGAYNLGAAMQQAGQGFGAQAQGTSADVKAKLDQLNAAGTLMYPLLQRVGAGGTVSGGELQQQIDQAHGMGLINDQQYQRVSGEIAKLPPGGNANGIVLGANMGNQAAISLLTGNVAGVNAGGQTVFRQTAPLGAPSPAAPVQMGLTPQNALDLNKWLKEPYAWTDKQGNPQQGTKLDYYESIGINPYTLFSSGNLPGPGADPQQLPTTSSGPVSGVTTGRAPVQQPGTPVAPAQPSAPATGAAPPQPASGQATGPPPPLVTPPQRTGAPPSTAATPPDIAASSQKAYADTQELQRSLPDRINPLINALSVLRANPDLQTAGQETLNDVKQRLAAYGVNVPNLTQANAYSELAKYLAQYTRGIPGANRSDLAALDAAAATPHMAQGPQVIGTLTAKLVGSERLRAAGVDQFNSQFSDPSEAAKNSSQYSSKTASWMSKQDPVAYAIDEMTPDEIKAYYSGLSPAAKKRFEDSSKDAYRLYQIRPGATVGRPATPPPAPPAPPPTPAPPAPAAPPPAAPPAPTQRLPTGEMTPSMMYGSGAGSP